MTRLAILLSCFLLGCSDVTAVTDEPDIQRMELLVDGSNAAVVQLSGSVSGPGIRLRRNVASRLEAVFRSPTGQVVAAEPDFQVEVVPANSAVLQYEPDGAKTGRLTGLILANTTVRIRLRHVSQGHDDFPFVTVNVAIEP